MPDGIYRVTWNYAIDPETGQMGSKRFFKYAQSAEDAMLGINSLDITAVLASDGEAEAYRSGFQDGQDVSKVGDRQRTFDSELLAAKDIQVLIENPSMLADKTPRFECGTCHRIQSTNMVAKSEQGLVLTVAVEGYESEWPLCVECAENSNAK
jgi:hypothetical protein